MLRNIRHGASASDSTWLAEYHADFKRRMLTLLGCRFTHFPSRLGLRLIDPALDFDGTSAAGLSLQQVNTPTPF